MAENTTRMDGNLPIWLRLWRRLVQGFSAKRRHNGACLFVYRDRSGEYRWRIEARNYHIMGDSGEGYDSLRNVLRAIDTLKAHRVLHPHVHIVLSWEAQQED